MSAIRIKHAVKLFGSIHLVVVESPANGKSDVILLTKPCEDELLPDYIECLEQTLSLPEDIQSSKDSTDVTLEIETELRDGALKLVLQLINS